MTITDGEPLAAQTPTVSLSVSPDPVAEGSQVPVTATLSQRGEIAAADGDGSGAEITLFVRAGRPRRVTWIS